MDEEVWLSICFGIFIILVGRSIVRAGGKFLNTQQENIFKEINDTENLYLETNNDLAKLQHAHNNLKNEVEQIIKQSADATLSLIKLKQQEFDNLLIRRQQQFEQQLNLESEKVREELQQNLRTQLAKQLINHFSKSKLLNSYNKNDDNVLRA